MLIVFIIAESRGQGDNGIKFLQVARVFQTVKLPPL